MFAWPARHRIPAGPTVEGLKTGRSRRPAPARPAEASSAGYFAAFLTTSAIAAVGLVVSAWLVRRPDAAGAIGPPDEPVREPGA